MDIQFKEFKRMFFDRAAVRGAMSDASRRALSKVGAFIRTRARSSIRKRKTVSEPGKPPSSHVGLLKQFLFFGYDANAQTVVVGPAKINKRGQVPRTLEFGGQVAAARSFLAYSPDPSRGIVRVAAGTQLNYRPRPYMGPALTKEIAAGTIPKQWQNAIQGR